jgi:hypothetical protein
MKHQGSWMAKVALVVVAMVGAAVVAAMDPTGVPMTAPGAGESALIAPNDAAGSQCPAEVLPTLKPAPDASAPEPVAICRLLPECWTDSDCDARCGVGLGKCLHSNCPPRYCRCR